MLLGRQRGRDRNSPQQRRGKRQHGVVGGDLRLRPPALDRRANALAAMRYGQDFGDEVDPCAEPLRQLRGQAIVAAFNPIHGARGRRLPF